MADEKIVEATAPKKIAKKAPKKKAARKKAAAKKSAVTTNKAVRSYPRITLEKCLAIAQKIKELNGGNPWTPEEIRNAIGVSTGNPFYYYTASSRYFGFTIGSSTTSQIGLTDLGREIVYAPNPNVEKAKKIEAFLKIDIFAPVVGVLTGHCFEKCENLKS